MIHQLIECITIDHQVYHPMYVDKWQNATLLAVDGAKMLPGMTVEQDVDGEYISYVTRDQEAIRQFCEDKEGVMFPCPIPAHPERYCYHIIYVY